MKKKNTQPILGASSLALLISLLSLAPSCAAGQQGDGGAREPSAFANPQGGVGNVIAGANVSGQESEYQNVIGDSIEWSVLRSFEKYEVRAYLPYKLVEYEWNSAVLLIEFAGIGGSERRPFHHVFEARIANDDPTVRQQSNLLFSLNNFGDVTDALGIVGQFFGVLDVIFTGGTATEFVTGGDRPSDTNNPEELKNFRPEGLTSGEGGTLRLVHDGYKGSDRFGYSIIEKWQKEHGFQKLKVTHHLYAAVVTGTRKYNCRNRREKSRQVNGQWEVYYVEDCDTWIDYQNPPELMAKGGYIVNF